MPASERLFTETERRFCRELPFKQGASRLTESIKWPPLRDVRETPATFASPSRSHTVYCAHNYRGEHIMKRHHIWVIVLVAITAVVLILMWRHAH